MIAARRIRADGRAHRGLLLAGAAALSAACFVDSAPVTSESEGATGSSSTGSTASAAADDATATDLPADSETTAQADSDTGGSASDSESGRDSGSMANDCPLQVDYVFLPSFRDDGLVDFPTLVRIGPDDLDFSEASADGSDIHFRSHDGGSELAFELDVFRPDATSVFWVRMPEISDAQPGFSLCYGGDAPDGNDPTQVWDDAFLGVWHATIDDNGSPALLDSSPHQAHGLLSDGSGGPTPIDSNVGSGALMDNERFYLADTVLPAVDGLTVEMVVASEEGFADEFHTGTRLPGAYELRISTGAGAGASMEVTLATAATVGIGELALLPAGSSYLTGTYDARDGTVEVCQNGACNSIVTPRGGPLAMPADQLRMGRFVGTLDEVRVSAIRRSRAWLDATAAALAGNLLDVAPPA